LAASNFPNAANQSFRADAIAAIAPCRGPDNVGSIPSRVAIEMRTRWGYFGECGGAMGTWEHGNMGNRFLESRREGR
jgi:hypothetical protein